MKAVEVIPIVDRLKTCHSQIPACCSYKNPSFKISQSPFNSEILTSKPIKYFLFMHSPPCSLVVLLLVVFQNDHTYPGSFKQLSFLICDLICYKRIDLVQIIYTVYSHYNDWRRSMIGISGG